MRKMEVMPGDEITKTISKAIRLAGHGDHVEFEFNGVTVRVAPDSTPELIHRDWHRGLKGYLGKNPIIGPFSRIDLTAAEVASDAAIEAENQRKSEIRRREIEKEDAAKTALLNEALSVAGPVELRDEAKWTEYVNANADPYGACCVRYAEKWARLMQTRIANGESIADFASETSHRADDEGITGFMYGAAALMLAECWKHGEELRRWHNKDTQIGTEGDEANETGGVLNPAMLMMD